MRIMQVVSQDGFNGAIKYVRDMANQLAQRRHDVTVVCMPNSWIGQRLAEDGLVRIVHSDLHRWPTDELRRIAGVYRQLGCEVLHTHNSRAHFFGALLRVLHRLPCMATAHHRHFQLHWALNDFVVANSAATLRYQRRVNMVRKSRSETIHYPIDTAAFARVTAGDRERVRAELGLTADNLALGIVGNVEPRKGHHFLLRALPAILTAYPSARLVVVGCQRDDYMRQLREEIADRNLEHAIVWAGYRADIPAVMHAIDLCVCAATEEAFGLTAAEALAAGTPVVATNVGGLPESVVHGKTGLLVPPQNPAALSEAIMKLLGDGPLRARLAAAGKQHVYQHFSVDAHYAALEDRYEQVAGVASPVILRPAWNAAPAASRRAA